MSHEAMADAICSGSFSYASSSILLFLKCALIGQKYQRNREIAFHSFAHTAGQRFA
jgi:hypothetical protein